METIGDRIRIKRKELNLTQAQLAEKLSITDRAISKWEQDEGNPDISLLAPLSEALGVTIDYLLTGKVPEKEIVIISRIELAAKKDDPSLIPDLSFTSANIKDETGKSLMDYVIQYKSYKLFEAMLKTCSHSTHYASFLSNRIDGEIFTWLIKADSEVVAVQSFNGSNNIRLLNDFQKPLFLQNNRRGEKGKISNDFDVIFKYLVEHFDELSQKQKDYYFSLDSEGMLNRTKCWFAAYPYFIDYAYRFNKALFAKLIKRLPTPNEWSRKINEMRLKYCGYFDSYFQRFSENYAFVYLLPSTLDSAIASKNTDDVNLINKYQKNPLDDYEIKIRLIDGNDDLSEEDKLLAKVERNGLIMLDIIKRIKDEKKVRKLLSDGFITYNELLLSYITAKDYKSLYKFAIDHQIDSIADALIRKDYTIFDDISRDGFAYLTPKMTEVENLNLKAIEAAYLFILKKSNSSVAIGYNKSCKFIYGKEKEAKGAILEMLAKEKDREKLLSNYKIATSEITEQYIYDLINKGETDMAIIKLCNKLEAMLAVKFNYEGDLFTMLDDWNRDYGQKDDGWGYIVEIEASKLLRKLRKQRNAIAHPTEECEKLTFDEFERCVKIVFEL